MARNHDHDHDQLSKKVKSGLPQVYIDSENDFAAIKISNGIEAKSFIQNEFIFCEDAKGNIIEIQTLNLSKLSKVKEPKRLPRPTVREMARQQP